MAKKKIPQIVKDIRNFKPTFINFGVEKVISHSQMNIFNECQFRWGLHYRDKKKINNPGIALTFGIAMHEVIQEYLEEFFNKSKASADRIDMESNFRTKLKQLYLKEYIKNNKIHYSNVEELDEHCIDGLEIIRYFKRKSGTYFSKRGWWLVGTEIPIENTKIPNVIYKGFLDVVLYHEPTNTIEIIDIKTSTWGWGQYHKKDNNKLAQLILYKKFLSENFNIDIKSINVKFLILKRKINEDSEYPSKRIQEFIPASGKNKTKQSQTLLDNFLSSAFNVDGTIKQIDFPKNTKSCKYCPYLDKPELCNRNNPNSKWRDPFDIS